MEIRDAHPDDAEAVCAIFNDAVDAPGVVWRDSPIDVATARSWIAGPDARLAMLVAVKAGRARGFAALSPFKPTIGWEPCVEISIYVAAAARGQGMGGGLIDAICARAAAEGRATVVASIDAENAGSIALHARHGFAHIGVIRRAGRQAGAERDVVLLQRLLAS